MYFPGQTTKMPALHICILQKCKRNSLAKPEVLKLTIQLPGLKLYKDYINDNPVLALAFVHAGLQVGLTCFDI